MTGFGRTAALGALAMLIGHGALAQSKPTVTITGVVRDSSGRPLEAAEVWLVGEGQTVTGADGSFRFVGLKNPIRSWIAARHIGYFPTQTSVTAEPGTESVLTIVMAPQPFNLPELTVRTAEKAQRRRLIDFVWRSRGGGGRFLSRSDIERSRVTRLGQLVIRYLPFKDPATMDQPGGWGEDRSFRYIAEWDRSATGVDFPSDVGGSDRFGSWGGSWSNRVCPPAVAVNGGSISTGRAVNDFEPDEVEGVEIYRGSGQLPFEYTMGGRSSCGLVVVWLRSFAREP